MTVKMKSLRGPSLSAYQLVSVWVVVVSCVLVDAGHWSVNRTSGAPRRGPELDRSGGCSSDRLAIYQVVLHTYWTREEFPKHYPDWRPPAQWSRTIG